MTVTNGGLVTADGVHVYPSGTLTGNAKVSTTSGTTVEGTLSPNWTLTIGGDLTFLRHRYYHAYHAVQRYTGELEQCRCRGHGESDAYRPRVRHDDRDLYTWHDVHAVECGRWRIRHIPDGVN